ALGVGGLAVALALQDTLANLFAGLELLIARQINPGDYIHFEGGEGCITDITLRNSVIRDVAGALIVVPNQKLSQATVTVWGGYSQAPIALSIPFVVSRDADLGSLERALVGKAVAAGVNEARLRYVTFTNDTVQCLLDVKLQREADPFKIRDAVLNELVNQTRSRNEKGAA
ncbi:MAG: mechanosensitive ion channel, partial [Candidatus Eremiobacteraeota bacterium]|nr:mechanosensitive ion channel [Candidatus Eremiobacteraeota bacterium]